MAVDLDKLEGSTKRRGRTVARWLAAATAVLGLVGLAPLPTSAHPGQPSAVFDPNRIDWAFDFNLTSSAFANIFPSMVANGYMVLDLEIETDGLVSAVWQKNVDGRAWRSKRGMNFADFEEEHDQAVGDGMRIVDFEVQPGLDPSTFAAVWVENREGYAWSFDHNLTASGLNSYTVEQRDLGRMPIDVERYEPPFAASTCNDCFAAIWVRNFEGLGWAIHWGMSRIEYGERWDEYRDSGSRPLVTQAHHDLFQGIWVQNRNGRGWASHRDMTSTVVRQRLDEYEAMGYRPVAIEKYTVGGPGSGWRYAMIWRQNN
jgi:hypothetical protein